MHRGIPSTTSRASCAMAPADPATAVRTRALVAGSALLVANQFWLIRVDQAGWSLFTDSVPYCTAITTLAALVGANGLAARFRPGARPWFTRAELMCVFAMICIGSVIGAGEFG